MNAHRNFGKVQSKILDTFLEDDFESIQSIANKLEIHRSSASRAIKRLAEDGYVEKRDKKWVLTTVGRTTAIVRRERIPAQIIDSLRGTTELIRQSTGINALTGIKAQLEPFQSPLVKAISGINSELNILVKASESVRTSLGLTHTQLTAPIFPTEPFPTIANMFSHVDFAEELGASSMVARIAHDMSAASLIPLPSERIITYFENISESQMKFENAAFRRTLFKEASANFAELGGLLGIAGPIFSAVDGLKKHSEFVSSVLRSSALLIGAELGTAAFSNFYTQSDYQETWHIPNVVRNYKGLVADRIATAIENAECSPNFDKELRLSSLAAESYVHAELEIFSETPLDQDPSIFANYEDILSQLPPRFSDMWYGMLRALGEENPDYVRQFAHSSREFLNQFLEFMAPRNIFSQDEVQRNGHEGRVTRKMQIKHILSSSSKSEAEMVAGMSKAINDFFTRVVGLSHNRSDSPVVSRAKAIGYVRTLQGIVMILIADRQSN